MAQLNLQFTWDEAREVFDQLPLNMTQIMLDDIFKGVRLSVVKVKQGYKFGWLNVSDERVVMATNITPHLFYELGANNVLKRKLIGASVQYLYISVQQFIESNSHNVHRKVQPDVKPSKNEPQPISEWESEAWDRTKYTPPTIKSTKGYMGGAGWEGSKSDVYANNRGKQTLAQLLRRELKEATDAGYLPQGLKYLVQTGKGGMTTKVDITIVGLGKNEDIYNYSGVVGRIRGIELEPHYQEIVDRVKLIHDGFNYDESNGQVDYFERGYYGRVIAEDEAGTLNRQVDTYERKLNQHKKARTTDTQEYQQLVEDFKRVLKQKSEAEAREQVINKELNETGTVDWDEVERGTQLLVDDIYEMDLGWYDF